MEDHDELPQSLRDRIVRIDERVRQLVVNDEKRDIYLIELRKDHAADFAEMRKDIDSLRLSRATFYGMSVALSAIISALIRVFWK
jgi:hypothetical protein